MQQSTEVIGSSPTDKYKFKSFLSALNSPKNYAVKDYGKRETCDIGKWPALTTLIRSGSPLVQLRKSHADPHGMLQKFLSTAFDACFFLLVERFTLEGVYTVSKALLHQ